MTEQAGSTLKTYLMQNGLVVGEMYEPNMPEATADVKDTSAQNNQCGVKTKLVSWIDHGVFACKVYYTGSPAHETLRADIYDRAMDTWTVVMPASFHGGGHGFSWTGQISKCKLNIDGEGPAYLELEITVNGKMTPTTTWATGLTTPFFAVVDDDSNALTPSPAAAGSTYEYDLEVYSDNAYIIITPTATPGTIYVNGTVVATGVASGNLALNVGTGQVTYMSIVVTELNKTPKIYWIRCHGGPTAHP